MYVVTAFYISSSLLAIATLATELTKARKETEDVKRRLYKFHEHIDDLLGKCRKKDMQMQNLNGNYQKLRGTLIRSEIVVGASLVTNCQKSN